MINYKVSMYIYENWDVIQILMKKTPKDTIFDALKLNASQSEWVGQIEMGQII